MIRWLHWCLLLLAASVLGPSEAANVDPRAQKKIDAFEKVLPEYERAADACERALQVYRDARDPAVRLAADAARLRIECLRSLRAIIAREPNYLIYHIPATAPAQWNEGMDYYLACARSATDPFQGRTSGVRTVRSPTDGQLLFYVFRLPKDYDPAKRYPLRVALHAGASLTWRAGWVDGKPSADPAKAEKEPHIWISPCGRGNNSYAGMGEVAVMDAIADAKHHYAVDADRVLIGGASMGGTGAFRLAALHPDVFAAAHALTGGANYAVPVGDGRFDATLLIDNFCNTGLCIWDAPREGWYKQNHEFAEALRERVRKYPSDYSHLELTDPNGGHGVIDRQLQAEGWDWLHQRRRDPFPRRVIYKTYCLRYDGAYWARIDIIKDAAVPARIEAHLDGARLGVALENVERFHLDLSRELVGDASRLNVSVDGGVAFPVPTGKTVHFAREASGWGVVAERYPQGLVKKHGLSGPIQDVFMGGPVLMVYGTHGKREPAEAEQMVDAAVLRLFGPGDGAATLHTTFERRADRDVTDKDIAEKHLVLFGSPSQNLLVQKIADRLPVKFLTEGVEVAGKVHQGKDIGVTLVYPNPLNPEHYVLLLPENYAGSSPWTYPDYVVSKIVQGAKGPTPQVLQQGSFDARWQSGR